MFLLHVQDWTLPASPFTTAIAERQIADACTELDEDTSEAAQLLTTELVNDALLDCDSDIRLTVRHGRHQVRIEIACRRLKPPTGLMPGRRRFTLIQRLATQWGIDSEDDGSYVVWFVLAHEPVEENEAVSV